MLSEFSEYAYFIRPILLQCAYTVMMPTFHFNYYLTSEKKCYLNEKQSKKWFEIPIKWNTRYIGPPLFINFFFY